MDQKRWMKFKDEIWISDIQCAMVLNGLEPRVGRSDSLREGLPLRSANTHLRECIVSSSLALRAICSTLTTAGNCPAVYNLHLCKTIHHSNHDKYICRLTSKFIFIIEVLHEWMMVLGNVHATHMNLDFWTYLPRSRILHLAHSSEETWRSRRRVIPNDLHEIRGERGRFRREGISMVGGFLLPSGRYMQLLRSSVKDKYDSHALIISNCIIATCDAWWGTTLEDIADLIHHRNSPCLWNEIWYMIHNERWGPLHSWICLPMFWSKIAQQRLMSNSSLTPGCDIKHMR